MRTIILAALAALLLATTANAAQMSSYTTKSTPVGADSVLINDSEAANATKKATISSIVALSPSMTYPGAGVPLSTGSAWGTSYTVGTAANNLVQLNASAQLPAVSADLLTVTDTGSYFTTDTVGAALQELGSDLAGVTEITLDASLTEAAGVLSVTNPVTDYDTDGDGDFTDEAWFPVGTGYTNLTQYLTQTAWRLFYSDGSGDVKELPIGDSGTVLQSNGMTTAPTWETPTGGTSGYLSTPPTYSDEACTPGQYALSESYRWDCVSSGNWNRTALTDWSNPTPVPPTLTSATVGTAGLYVDLLFSETVEAGTGGNGGWSMDCATTGAISMTYSSGDTTNTLSYSLGDTPLQGETCTVSYTQPTDGIEAVDDSTDLATISSAAVTNNSTVQPEGITCTGSETFIRGVSASGDTESFEMGVGDTCASDWTVALDAGMSTYSSGAAHSGTHSLIITDDSATSPGMLEGNHGSAQTEQYYRFYIKFANLEAYKRISILGPSKYSTLPSYLRLSRPGSSTNHTLEFVANQSETIPVVADVWYRVEMKVSDADGSGAEYVTVEAKVYNAEGTAIETSAGGGDTTLNATTIINSFQYFTILPESISTIASEIYIDDIKNCNTWCGAE